MRGLSSKAVDLLATLALPDRTTSWKTKCLLKLKWALLAVMFNAWHARKLVRLLAAPHLVREAPLVGVVD